MSKVFKTQHAFNSGVLTTRMLGRNDTKQYFNGMEQGDNVLCLPQGGVNRRPGMEFIYSMTDYARVVPFVFSNTQNYLFIFQDQALHILKDDVYQASIVTTYLEADLMGLYHIQSGDTMIVVHPDYPPRLIQRMGSDTSWSISDMTFDFVPQYDFDDASSPTPTTEVQTITFNSFTAGQDYKLTLEGIDTEDISYSSNTATNESSILSAINDLPHIVYGDVSVSHTTGTSYQISLSGGNAKDWDEMTGRSTSGTTTANITVTTNTNGSPRAEDVWSSTRGYPRSVVLHEGRMWFGGSRSLPVTLWGSRVGEFFNFDLGKSRDDQAIDITLDIDQYDAVTALYSNRHLQVFTGSAEYYVPVSPITPENIAVKRQSGYGSKAIQPKVIDGATIFLQRTGRSLREFVYEFAEDAYVANTTSLLAPELLVDPVDMCISVGTDIEDANYVYVVNSDGTVAVFNTLREQNVAGWSRWITDGNIKNICRLVDDIYFTVERTINGTTKYYVEKANDAAYMDCSVLYTSPATATLTGLSHLNGEECYVRADDSVMETGTPSGGALTIERVAFDSAEVGLFYAPTIKTMPIEGDLGAGVNLNGEKRITNCLLYVQETNSIIVNDTLIPFRTFGENVLGKAVEPFTGKKEVYLLGWSKTAQVTVTQDVPAPMTLLSINLEMEIS